MADEDINANDVEDDIELPAKKGGGDEPQPEECPPCKGGGASLDGNLCRYGNAFDGLLCIVIIVCRN